jgi:hypothetical protein
MTPTEIPQAALWPCQSVVNARSGPRAGIDPASETCAGNGRSTLPADAPQHAQSSKRAMAGDMVSLMRHLGHEQLRCGGP